MENFGSCSPKSQPYFLSTEGYSDKNPGPFLRASGLLSQYQHSVDKNNQTQLKFIPPELSKIFTGQKAGVARSILALSHTSGEKLVSDALTPVSGHKCFCQSVWCPTCFRRRFHDRVIKIFKPYDWQATRHVILTIDPSLFESPTAAFNEIREKRLVAQFIRRLRRGVKEKIGNKWVQKFQSLQILRWAWFLEWHENGFPHYHVFIQVPQNGSAGMIGGDRLRDSWKMGKIVKELYFNDKNHFQEMTGYYANKGYFEKGKQYQGRLPENILENISTKIRRMNSSEKRAAKDKVGIAAETSIDNPIEGEIKIKNFKDCMNYFKEEFRMKNLKDCIELFNSKMGFIQGTEEYIKAVVEIGNVLEEDGHHDAQPLEVKKKQVNYQAILANCGQATYMELDIGNYRLQAIVELPWKKWKERCGEIDSCGKGYISKLSRSEVFELLGSVRRVCSLKKYMDIPAYVKERVRIINNAEAFADLVLMRN